MALSGRFGKPSRHSGISRAGINIQLESTDENEKPVDIRLDIKKPGGDDIPDPEDENSLTATGKLALKFGKRGTIEFFAENTSRIKEPVSEQEEET